MVTETEKPIDAPPGDSREALLIRQVENKIKQEGHKEAGSAVSFSKLLTAANGKEKLQLWMGWIFAFLAGITIPLLFLFMGDVFDSFNSSPDEARRKVRELMIIMGSIGIGILMRLLFSKLSSCKLPLTSHMVSFLFPLKSQVLSFNSIFFLLLFVVLVL